MSAWKRLLAMDDKSVAPSSDPWVRAAASDPSPDAFEGFARARRSRSSATAWLWAKRVAIGFVLLAGIIQLVIKPIRNVIAGDQAPPPAAVSIDLQTAGATATGFALDYLSSAGGGWEPYRSAALQQWLYPDAFPQGSPVGAWSGQSVLIADSASVQSTLKVGDDAAVIAVQARVRTFMPGEGAAQMPPPPPQEAGSAAFVPQVPAGYTAGPAYWVRLAVPVVDSPNGPRVSAPGPIFTADDLTPLEVTLEGDRDAAKDLNPVVQTIFDAYAASDLQYVAADDSDLIGLAGTVTVKGVDAVRASSATNGDGSRNLSAEITWELSGTDASIAQSYALTVTDIASSAPQLQHISVLQPARPDHS